MVMEKENIQHLFLYLYVNICDFNTQKLIGLPVNISQQTQTTVSNTKGATIGAGTAYLSGAPEVCFGSWCSIFSIHVVFC